MKDWASEEEEGKGSFLLYCFWGAFVSIVVCGGLIGSYVAMLPPPEPRDWSKPEPGPVFIDGIEVVAIPEAGAEGDGGGGASAEGPAATPAAPATAAPPQGWLEALGDMAVLVNAATFRLPEGVAADVPLIAIVVQDSAAADPGLRAQLLAQPYPLTIGIVAGSGGDFATGEAARAAGYEVLAELPLAATGAGQGILLENGLGPEEAVGRTLGMMERLPMAVAATWAASSAATPAPELLQGMARALGHYGFAYLDRAVPEGEESAAKLMDLPLLVGVNHLAIPAGLSAPEIMSVLDLAAQEAAATGGAVIFAPAEEGLLTTLELWTSGAPVQIAPLSAVLGRQTTG